MWEQDSAASYSSRPAFYEIRMQGRLDERTWRTWFGEMTITFDEHGNTLLRGEVVDQAALYGYLRKVRDLGIPLLAVIRHDQA